MRVSLIVAMSDNRVIGRDGGLPWRLPADLKRFKRLTMGHHVIVGRKTFESIGRLPGRKSIVLTRQQDYRAAGELVAHDLDEALRSAAGDDEVFIIGGAEIYQQALHRADRMYVTLVHAQIEGDTRFPAFDANQWRSVDQTRHLADQSNPHDYSFRVLDHKKRAGS